MTIECYEGECIHHCFQDDPEEGPFCFENKCEYEVTRESFIKFRTVEQEVKTRSALPTKDQP